MDPTERPQKQPDQNHYGEIPLQPQSEQQRPYMPPLTPFGPGLSRSPDPVRPAPVQQNPAANPYASNILPNVAQPTVEGANNGNSSSGTFPPAQFHDAYGGQYGGPGEAYPFKAPRSSRKFVLIVLLLLILLIGAGAGYYFALYLPNTPENVYKTGLARTGMAFDRMVADARQENRIEKFVKSELTGSAVINGPDGRQSGTFSSQYDDKNSSSKLTYSPDDKGKDLQLQVLSDLAEGAKYPDIYFSLSGMSAVKLNDIIPGIDQYEGKWINAAPAFWESVVPATEQDDKTAKDSEFTEQDFNALTKIVVDTSNEYVLTNDKAKNVLILKSVKGSDTIEGQQTYRYTVGFDKEHAMAYCKVMARRIIDSPAYKHIPAAPQEDLGEVKKETDKSCDDSAKDIKETDTIDLWVSRQTKLISQVRSYDKEDKGNYIDVGQKYVSGDSIPMYVKLHSDKEKVDMTLTMDIDFTKSTAKFTAAAEFTTNNNKDEWKINLTLASKPYESEIKVVKPKEFVPVDTFLQTLGLDEMLGNGAAIDAPAGSPLSSAQAKAKDTERQTDLKSLQGQLEAYYAQNGFYPAVNDLNAAAWRKANMKGLDDQSLADPDGKMIEVINGKSSPNMYGYEVQACDAASPPKCEKYILTSMLSTGSLYTLNSLN